MKFQPIYSLLFLLVFINACSPSIENQDGSIITNIDTIPVEMEQVELAWHKGNPTLLKCEFPDPNLFFILKKREGIDPILTEDRVSILESKPGHLQLIWENNGETLTESIQQISKFEYENGMGYDIKTTQDFGSYEDNIYELIMPGSENYWVLNNVYSDDPSVLLAAMGDGLLFESPRDTAIINLKSKFNTFSDNEIFVEFEKDWIGLSKENDDWVIYSECRYGPGGLYFDFDEGWLEFSGGGDAYSKDIDTLILHEKFIEMRYGNRNLENGELEYAQTARLYITENGVLIFKIEDKEDRYISSENQSSVRFVEEECDEEDY